MLIPHRFIAIDLGNAKLCHLSRFIHRQRFQGRFYLRSKYIVLESRKEKKSSQETDDFRKHRSGKAFTKTEIEEKMS